MVGVLEAGLTQRVKGEDCDLRDDEIRALEKIPFNLLQIRSFPRASAHNSKESNQRGIYH